MGNVDKRVETPNQLHPQATKGVSKPRLKPCKETWKVRPSFKTVETGLNALKRRRKLKGDRGKSNYRGAKSLKNNLWGQNLFGINAASFNLKFKIRVITPCLFFMHAFCLNKNNKKAKHKFSHQNNLIICFLQFSKCYRTSVKGQAPRQSFKQKQEGFGFSRIYVKIGRKHFYFFINALKTV